MNQQSKKTHYTMIKGPSHQVDTTILNINIYVPNTWVSISKNDRRKKSTQIPDHDEIRSPVSRKNHTHKNTKGKGDLNNAATSRPKSPKHRGHRLRVKTPSSQPVALRINLLYGNTACRHDFSSLQEDLFGLLSKDKLKNSHIL